MSSSRPPPAASLPSCDNGRGVVRYERLPDTVVDGNPIQEDVVSVTAVFVSFLTCLKVLSWEVSLF